MGTAAGIAYDLDNGSVVATYCHFDGYLEGVGVTLNNHYTTFEQVKSLVDLGYMRSLGDTPDSTEYYCRDRGEGLCVDHEESVAKFADNYQQDVSYIYLWSGGRWLVAYFGNDWQFEPLADVLARELVEDLED